MLVKDLTSDTGIVIWFTIITAFSVNFFLRRGRHDLIWVVNQHTELWSVIIHKLSYVAGNDHSSTESGCIVCHLLSANHRPSLLRLYDYCWNIQTDHHWFHRPSKTQWSYCLFPTGQCMSTYPPENHAISSIDFLLIDWFLLCGSHTVQTCLLWTSICGVILRTRYSELTLLP